MGKLLRPPRGGAPPPRAALPRRSATAVRVFLPAYRQASWAWTRWMCSRASLPARPKTAYLTRSCTPRKSAPPSPRSPRRLRRRTPPSPGCFMDLVAHALFAGRDASRALAKMSFEPSDLTSDISGLGPF